MIKRALKILFAVIFALFCLRYICGFFLMGYTVPSQAMFPNYRGGATVLVSKLSTVRTGDVVLYAHRSGEEQILFIRRIVARGGDHLTITNNRLAVNGEPLRHLLRDGSGEWFKSIPEFELDANTKASDYKIIEEGLGANTYLTMQTNQSGLDYHTVDITIPDGSVFLLGDNREHAFDSRTYGPIATKDLLGKVIGEW